jgi:hypothetical protein
MTKELIMSDSTTVEHINWQGITIEVIYWPVKWGSIAHIEVRSIEPKEARIPITETGYRSHFLPIGTLEAEGITVKDLVLGWIDEQAFKPEWKQYAESQRQGDLFDL